MVIKTALVALVVPFTLLVEGIFRQSLPDAQLTQEAQPNAATLVWNTDQSDSAPSGLYISVDALEFVHVPTSEYEEYFAVSAPPTNTCPTDPYPQCIGNTTCPKVAGKVLVGCVANFSDCGCLYISQPDAGADFDRAMVDLYYPGKDAHRTQEITFMDGGQLEVIRDAVSTGLTIEYWLDF